MPSVTKALVVGALLLALVCATASQGAVRTTAPGNHVLVYFVINNKKIAYEILRTSAGGGTDQLYLERNVLRGDVATFYIINRDKKAHGFVFFGHKIRSIKPGHRVHFSASLIHRGEFPYASTPREGKAFRGVFPVL